MQSVPADDLSEADSDRGSDDDDDEAQQEVLAAAAESDSEEEGESVDEGSVVLKDVSTLTLCSD